MTTVLITAIGGDVAQGVAKVIRESRPEWRIIGADIDHQNGGSHFVDNFVLAPRAQDAGYLDWITDQIFHHDVDFFIPMNEAEIERVSTDAASFPKSAHLVTAGRKAVNIARDKITTARFLKAIGLPAPWSVERVDDVPLDGFPCIFKPRSGAGSRAVYVCSGRKEAQFLNAKFPNSMFQELLLPDDAEVTVAVFRDSTGETAVLQLQRRLVGGATGWAEVINDKNVTEHCRRIAEGLDLRGAINVQLRRTAKGPRVFEINARFSSTALMRHRLGFSDVIWTLDDLSGQSVSITYPLLGQKIARVYDAVILR